ncbi:uncharacterized protein METZ01_LOCUS7913 [marine metagenome]|uniref:Uncharacterized protein n=1 Tax=marine metagenome TaxID=408172 RepID=A0A381NL21_9ZZZZ
MDIKNHNPKIIARKADNLCWNQ